jgi:hypothetical protein
MAGQNTLKTRLQLVGGDAVRKDLRQVGTEGQNAFAALQKAAKSNKGVLARLSKSIAETKDAWKKAAKAWSDAGKAFDKAGKSFSTVGKNVGIATAAVTGAGAALAGLAFKSAETSDALGKAAQSVGLSVDAYSKLSYAAEQGGANQEQLRTGLVKLSQELGRAAEGNQSAMDKFARLGIEIRDAGGNMKSTDQIIADLADRMAAMPDGADKSAAAVELLGEAGVRLIPTLNGGADGLKALGDQAERLGIAVSDKQAKEAAAFNDAWDNVARTFGNLAREVGAVALPELTRLFDYISSTVASNRQDLVRWVEDGWSYAVQVVKDFIAVITGDGSAVNPWVADLVAKGRELGEQWMKAINDVILPALTAFWEWLDKIAKMIGLESGAQLGLILLVGKLSGAFGTIVPAIAAVKGATKAFFAVLKLGIRTAIGATGIGLILVALGLVYEYWDKIKAGAQALWDSFKRMFPGMAETIKNALGDAVDWVIGRFEALWSLIQRVYRAVRDTLAAAGNAVGDVLGFSQGGAVHGPGTSTSDSIPARLSDGEFVLRAAAVRSVGVGFLNRLNAYGASILDGPARFADGGLVVAGAGAGSSVVNDHSMSLSDVTVVANDPESLIRQLNGYADRGGPMRLRDSLVGRRGVR